MPQVISSITQAAGRGVYIIPRRVISAVRASGTGRCVMIAQLLWGPLDTETAFDSPAAFRDTFAPDGFDRTGSGYLMATKFPWVDLQVIRVLGAGPAKATINMQKAGPANCVAVEAKYYGSGGNGITCVVANASNGTGTSFDLTISKTDASTGLATSETYLNVDSTQAAGAYWTGLTAASKLVGPLVKSASGRPDNGTYVLATGSDGAAIGSANYLGTPGSADKGLALAENDDQVAFVFTDDVGSGNLAAVNAGLKAHEVLMADKRIAVLQGLPAETSATALTNAALDQLDHCAYQWPHCTVSDDQGVTRTIPLTGAFAALCSAMTPHLSPAYKRSDFTKVVSAITGLDVAAISKTTKDALESGGVVAWEKNPNGTFSPYSDVATDGTPIFATRMSDYMTFTMASALEDYRNAPNDDETIQDERSIVEGVLAQLKENRRIDHIFRPSIVDYEMVPTAATNTTDSMDAGDITHQFKAKIASAQKRIFLVGEVGTTVKIATSST